MTKIIKRTDGNGDTLFFGTHTDAVQVEEGGAKKSLTEVLGRMEKVVSIVPNGMRGTEFTLGGLLRTGYWNENMEIHTDGNYQCLSRLLSGNGTVRVYDGNGDAVSFICRGFKANGEHVERIQNLTEIDLSQYDYVGLYFSASVGSSSYRLVFSPKVDADGLLAAMSDVAEMKEVVLGYSMENGMYYSVVDGVLKGRTAATLCRLETIPCAEGDVFVIHTRGRNAGHPYYIASGLGVAPDVDSGVDNDMRDWTFTVTAQQDGCNVYVNVDAEYKDELVVRKNGKVVYGSEEDSQDGLSEEVAALAGDVEELVAAVGGSGADDMVCAFGEDGHYTLNNGLGVTAVEKTSGNYRTTGLIPCTEGDVFVITGRGSSDGGTAFLYAFADSGGVVMAVPAEGQYNVLVTDLEVTAPAGSAYFVMNCNVDAATCSCVKKGSSASGLVGRVEALESPEKTLVLCWGSSSIEGYQGDRLKYLSSGSYVENASGTMSIPKRLAELLEENCPDKFEVWNCGIGGEGMTTILSRMGAIPMYNDTEFTIPGDGSWVDIARYDQGSYMKSSYDGSIVVPRHNCVDSDHTVKQSVLNPVIVNGIECEIALYALNGGSISSITNDSKTDNTFANGCIKLRRKTVATSDVKIPVGTLFTPYAAKLFQGRNVINIFLIGANGGWWNVEDFEKKILRCVDWFGSSKYLVLGYHTQNIPKTNSYANATQSQFGINLPTSEDFRVWQKKTYGLKFLDSRYLLSKRWFEDFGAEFGLNIYYVSANGAGTFNGHVYAADDVSVIPQEYRSLLEEMPVEWKNYGIRSDIQAFNDEGPACCLMADPTASNFGSHCNYNGYKVFGTYVYRKLVELGWVKEDA